MFELITGYLNILFLSDYAFYSMLILLGLGSILSFSGYKVGYSDPSNKAGVAASTLVDNSSPKLYAVTKLENTTLGSRLLIASLIPLCFCILY
ncbi:MAG: hypothetical protein GY787_07335 [Alteromonadales bacterium]|nr:hypothetical protein [Alteromonadales bacterium]